MQAQNKTDKCIASLEELSQRVTELPDDFILNWGFAGTRHFIETANSLKSQNWLLEFIETIEAKDRQTLIKAIQKASFRLKQPV